MVPEKHLSRVAGLNQTVGGILNVVAPPGGALLLSVLPLHGIMGIDLATALTAIVPLLFVAIPQPVRTAATGGGARPSVWDDLRAGARYVWSWPGLVAILILAMVINFVVNPAFSLMPLLVTDHFQGGALELGGLESAWGIGVVLGGLLLAVWGGFRRRVLTSLLGLVVGGCGILAIGLVPARGFALAVAAIFVAGFTNPLINGPFMAILQVKVEPEMQGRVFTLVSSVATAMMPLSLAVAGPLADAIGVRAWYVAGGAIFAVLGLASFFVPVIVNIEHSRPGIEVESPEPAMVEIPVLGE
jgi:DHA3 family macrolide efflux protein-like MFS transporter